MDSRDPELFRKNSKKRSGNAVVGPGNNPLWRVRVVIIFTVDSRCNVLQTVGKCPFKGLSRRLFEEELFFEWVNSDWILFGDTVWSALSGADFASPTDK
jgi:hypothetical protein